MNGIKYLVPFDMETNQHEKDRAFLAWLKTAFMYQLFSVYDNLYKSGQSDYNWKVIAVEREIKRRGI